MLLVQLQILLPELKSVKYTTEQGVITKISRAKEQDIVLHMFTKSEGMQVFLLKHAGGAKSKRKYLLELMNLVQFRATASNNLKIITEIKLTSNFSILKSPENLYAESFLIAEVLNRFIPEGDSQVDLWDQLIEYLENQPLLEKIAGTQRLSRLLCLHFSLKVLHLLGFLPSLNTDEVTAKKLDPEIGIVPASSVPGYRQSNSVDPDPLILQAIKVQQFWLKPDTQTSEAFNIKIEDSLIKRMLNIQLDWIELVQERNLQSRMLLKFD